MSKHETLLALRRQAASALGLRTRKQKAYERCPNKETLSAALDAHNVYCLAVDAYNTERGYAK